MAGDFEQESERSAFPEELASLQIELRKYSRMLADIAGVEDLTDLEATEWWGTKYRIKRKQGDIMGQTIRHILGLSGGKDNTNCKKQCMKALQLGNPIY